MPAPHPGEAHSEHQGSWLAVIALCGSCGVGQDVAILLVAALQPCRKPALPWRQECVKYAAGERGGWNKAALVRMTRPCSPASSLPSQSTSPAICVRLVNRFMLLYACVD